MRRSSFIFCSTSALAIAVTAAPASAQVSDPAAPVDPAAEAQTSPAPDPAAGQATTDDDETIVVTGLRRSLQTSQNIKKNSDQIVDVVVAEDIGKLPDRTVSEALARVPGVTVERASAEAGDVFVRGLRDPATTYNGRDIFTAEARSVAPQDFPAGGVAALEVFKSQTADQIEGNLAGLINVRSRRPFDFAGLEIAGSVNATYADLAKDWAWNGNLLVSDRWNVGDGGEVGALLNVSYTELTYNDNIRFNSGDFFGINPDPNNPGSYCDNFDAGCLGFPPPGNVPGVTVRVPVGVGLFQNDGTRWRPSANAALQWKVNPDLELYADGLYQGFRREVSDRQLFVPLFDSASYTNVVIGESGDLYDYPASLISRTRCCVPDGFQAATYEKTNTYQGAFGGVYDTDRVRVAVDLAHTKSQFDLSIYSVDYRLNASPTVNVEFDGGGDGGAQFDFTGVDVGDINSYLYRGFFDRHLTAKGNDIQGRLDVTFKNIASWVPAIDIGMRYNDRDAGFTNAERYSTRGENQPWANLPLDFNTITWRFRDDQQGLTQLVMPSYDSIRGSIDELRVIAGFAPGRPVAGAADDRSGPFDDYNANEKGLTGYGQIRYNFDAGAIPIDGVVGLRAIRTSFQLDGVVNNNGVISPLTIKNNYTDYLPNLSIRAHLSSQLQVRAAYTETRKRPDFGQLNPGLRLDPPPGPGQVRTGSGGNPFLRPILSNNYDMSLEYYFSRSGFAALALFRRDVSNFIVNFEAIQDIPGVGPVRVFGPANTNKGKIQGAEAQFRTFLDFDGVPQWAKGFGTELNVTYIDNSLDAPPNFVDQSAIAFPDVSKWSYNLVGFYEQGRLTARVAYNYRSKYVQFYENRTNSVAGEFTKGVSRLDASIGFNLTDNLTIAADVSNILGKPFRNFRTTEDGVVFPRDVRYEERVYSFGVRARLGGGRPHSAEPAPVVLPPPPPPVVEPAPVVEEPAPPPPPPPSGERG
ncbi:MAG: TonB-dependent receptor [Sphingomicrobium sp.]